MSNPHVTFIHGIANKPPLDDLIQIWVRGLATDSHDGAPSEPLDLDAEGVTYGMCYWADVMYAKPDEVGAVNESLGTEASPDADDEDLGWADDLPTSEQAFVDGLRDRLDFDVASPAGDDFQPPVDEAGANFERVPLPWFIKRRLMKILLRDVHHYLFNNEHTPRPNETYQIRDEIRARMLAVLEEGADRAGDNPHVVVSHSMGTVIAYDCLKRVDACPNVSALLTIGSPLGLDEIQDKLHPESSSPLGWSRNDGYPAERVGTHWVNVYDRLDPVAGFDPKIANDYRHGGSSVVIDVHEKNYGRWRHSIEKYLSGPQLRKHIRDSLGL